MPGWLEEFLGPDKPTPAAVISPVAMPTTNGHGRSSYGQAALNAELQQLLDTTEGSRNDQLNRAAFSLAQLVASGHLPDLDTQDQLRAAALHIGLTPTEVEATLRSAFRAGNQLPRAVPELTVHVTEVGALRPPIPPSEDTSESTQTRTSWWPEPLAHRAAQAAEEPEPTHLIRDDGRPLMYSGKVNGLIGESESGKSWVALLVVVQALSAGQRILILDFEDSPGSVYERLHALGCTAAQLELVDYANPDESFGLIQSDDLQEALQNRYQVIVADGVNVAMTLLGYDLNSNTDASLFRSRLLQPLARHGACVITIDHVPKNPDNRGKGGIGAQAKRALQDGACLLVEIVEPFGKGHSGILKLTVDKDRNGAVRGISGGGKYAGKAHIDSVANQVRIHIEPPDLRPAAERDDWRPTGVMEKVSRLLERAAQAMSGNEIHEAVQGRRQTVLQAISELVAAGCVVAERRSGRGGGDAYKSVRNFREGASTELVPTGSQLVPGTGYETGSHPIPPYGDGNQFDDVPEPNQAELVPGTTSNCSRCGQPTPDGIIEETAGYCRPCGRIMNP
jgi:hypothetical protein